MSRPSPSVLHAVLLASLLVVLHAPQTHAWGRVGHKVVCEIAWSELTQVTKAAVTDLLAEDPAGATFAESCVWADEEVQKKARQLDHFINVPRYYYEIRSGQCRLGDRCLFSAIDHEVNVLSYSSDSRQRLDALRYLGHWVGDIHQPLHVSYADDQGGNKIDESGPCSFSLHSVWDSCVIAQMLGGDHMQIAQTLRGAVDSDERTRWIDTMVVDWAEESYLIARDQQVQYCELRGRVCWYDSSHERWREGLPEKVVKVDDVYLAVAAPVVSERLQQAGVRLGALLNRIFDPPVFD